MRDLRFQINANNLDLCKIFAGLGYNQPNSELNKEEFYQFLRLISPSARKSESDYIFNNINIEN
jgi:hypothetical protein